jgi:putative oxidoreductase
MNFRNKYLLHTLRILFGLLMLASGVMGLLGGRDPAGVPPALVPVTHAFWDSGIFQMIKVTEAVVGLMFLANFLPALAAIFIAPVSIGIVVFNAVLMPSFVIIGVIICLFNAYFGYAYWNKYKSLFSRK